MSFVFVPTDGYRNTTSFPTKPNSETEFRDQMQDLLDQIRDYMNTSLLIVTDGVLSIAKVDQRLLLQSFYEAGGSQYAVIDSTNAVGDPIELKINPSVGDIELGGPVTIKFVDQRLKLEAVYQAGIGQYGLVQATNGAGTETEMRINPNGEPVLINGGAAWHAGNAGPFYKGTGSPEGVVAAAIGSIYQRSDGGLSTTFYVKESGSGNTGWTAK